MAEKSCHQENDSRDGTNKKEQPEDQDKPFTKMFDNLDEVVHRTNNSKSVYSSHLSVYKAITSQVNHSLAQQALACESTVEV